MISITIAILAGGASRRMGTDKAALTYRGRTMLEHVADTAVGIGPTAVVGREDADAFDLPGVKFLPDRELGLGPLGGLRTALEEFDPPVVLIGCDMPLVESETIRWLVEAYEDRAPIDGLVAENERGIQPLFGVYTPDVLEVVATMIDEGERSLHRLVKRCDVAVHRLPDRFAGSLVNVNTPEEFRELTEQ